jgi:hypothetical protein
VPQRPRRPIGDGRLCAFSHAHAIASLRSFDLRIDR